MKEVIVEGYAGCVDQGLMLYECDIPDLDRIIEDYNSCYPAQMKVDKELILKRIWSTGKYFLAY